jgi:formylglycine-generating enzyme required for sulfatase activity
VFIPSGSFTMGSPVGELGRNGEEVQHQVTVSRAFWMKATEVTQEEWLNVMGSNPSGSGCNRCPVERVTWNASVDYLNQLSDAAGLPRCYDASRAFQGLACLGYRLPTEAEWEYSARAGTQTTFYSGGITQSECQIDRNLDIVGWYCGNAGNSTRQVGGKQPNAWGLFDMHGNVWEWVNDWYGPYPAGALVDPVGPLMGAERVQRGGCWNNPARLARAAQRASHSPSAFVDNNLGFRPVRSIP